MRRIILALTLLALTFTLVPKAFAAVDEDWLFISTTRTGSRMYASWQDLRAGRPDSTAARVWLKTDHRNDATTSIRVSMTLYVVNCVAKTYRKADSIHYFPDGTSEHGSPDYTTRFIIPDTNFAFVSDVLCAAPDSGQVDYR